MSYCMFCRKNVSGGARFCPNCGAEVVQIPAAAGQPPVPPQVAPVYVTQQVLVNNAKKSSGCGCAAVILVVLGAFCLVGNVALRGCAEVARQSVPAAQPQMSVTKFEQIRLGMSYAEVSNCIGSPGRAVETTPDGVTRYIWGDDGWKVTAHFKDGRLMSKFQVGLR